MIAPSPGSPDVEFTAEAVVGGVQKGFTDVPDEGFALNAPGWPISSIGKTWQSCCVVLQVWPHWHDVQVPGEPTQLGGLQSASVLQPRNVSMLHVEIVGPCGPQWPMPICSGAGSWMQTGSQV